MRRRPWVRWEVGLAEDLRKPGFARGFLIACVEHEDIPLQEALATVIRCLGVEEYAAKVRMPVPDVRRAIRRRHNPTQETLNRLLKPLGLRTCLAPIKTVATAEQRKPSRRRGEGRTHSRAAA